jgi:hypothetical protein
VSDYWSGSYLDDLNREWESVRDRPRPADLICPTPCYAHRSCADVDPDERDYR